MSNKKELEDKILENLDQAVKEVNQKSLQYNTAVKTLNHIDKLKLETINNKLNDLPKREINDKFELNTLLNFRHLLNPKALKIYDNVKKTSLAQEDVHYTDLPEGAFVRMIRPCVYFAKYLPSNKESYVNTCVNVMANIFNELIENNTIGCGILYPASRIEIYQYDLERTINWNKTTEKPQKKLALIFSSYYVGKQSYLYTDPTDTQSLNLLLNNDAFQLEGLVGDDNWDTLFERYKVSATP